MKKELFTRANIITGTLQKGVEYYLDNWQQIQEDGNFPITTNEESYRAEAIIRRIATIQNAILLAERDDNEYIGLLSDSLQSICDYTDDGYSEYFSQINKTTKAEEN